MKSLKNKSFTIDGNETNYVQITKAILNNPGDKGLSPLDQIERVRVINRLPEENAEKLEFEDSDFLVLKSALQTMRFAMVSEEIAGYCEKISNTN